MHQIESLMLWQVLLGMHNHFHDVIEDLDSDSDSQNTSYAFYPHLDVLCIYLG